MVEKRELWQQKSGYDDRNIVFETPSIAVVKYKLQHDKYNLIGRRMVFFADLHYNGAGSTLCEELVNIVNKLAADWIVFGGDLVRYSVYLEKALSFLDRMTANVEKIATYGNWDRRRRSWFPHYQLQEIYSQAGFRLLINERLVSSGIQFYGIDDYKSGFPELNVKGNKHLNCVVSHSPDSIVDDRFTCLLDNIDLILCGHTHGGQVRIPGYGAVITSSIHRKKFEYGHYLHKNRCSEMIVTSGIGTSALPFRLFCKPEVVVVEF